MYPDQPHLPDRINATSASCCSPLNSTSLTTHMHLIYLALDISHPAPIPTSHDVPPLHEAHDFRRPTSFPSATYDRAMPRRL
jgi:hypothetical protein